MKVQELIDMLGEVAMPDAPVVIIELDADDNGFLVTPEFAMPDSEGRVVLGMEEFSRKPF